ncbi:MAG: DNA polymerase ligase N-terminal domain-containing protein [Planctomycetota bacterium]|jgi:bifunctional non-homologous end joining protein LigD
MELDKRKFVLQKHTNADGVHWDLMLQVGRVLETYRLELPPEEVLHHTSPAIKIFDHPLKFLTYEGTLSEGKGFVEIADSGNYQLLSEEENCREIQLEGTILDGNFALRHVETHKWEFYLRKSGRSGST